MAESPRAVALVTDKGKTRARRTGAAPVLRAAVEAERLRRERHAVVNQRFRGPYAPFHHWKDHNDDDSEGDGMNDDGVFARYGGHVYKVTVMYLALLFQGF